MNALKKNTLLAGLVLAPLAAFGQSTLVGPTSTLEIDDTFGKPEPVVLMPNGGDNVLFQNVLLVQTDGVIGEDVYYDGVALADTTLPDSILMSRGLNDVIVDVLFRKSSPPDGPLDGTLLMDYFIMDVTITNSTADRVNGIVANYWDFEMVAGLPDDDILTTIVDPDFVTFAQSNAGTDVVAFASAEMPDGFSGDQFPFLIEDLFDKPLGGLGTTPPGVFAQDWSVAFETGFELGVDQSTTVHYAIGVLDTGAPVIPEPSALGLLALPLIAAFVGLRRRRT